MTPRLIITAANVNKVYSEDSLNNWLVVHANDLLGAVSTCLNIFDLSEFVYVLNVLRMPNHEMLDEMLDEAVKRIQHWIQQLKTKFVFDLDQTSSNINLQLLDHPTWVVKRIQHFIQHWFSACWMKCWMRLTGA